ncbi:Alpha/Beta hydrolase protein [Globomyces pollinis-pini]|nr:Alpha/Beta hydrolase protein [Globomyces pollinis-pini]
MMTMKSYEIALTGSLLTMFGLYKYYLPSDTGNLGSLKDTKSTIVTFKEDHWPEHGYVDLPYGKTHYYFIGPKNGKRLVFVHGISTPAPCLPRLFDILASKGYRILCYDLYGRGYSDSPGTIYNNGLFIVQLANLLQYFDWKGATIIGYSLGGAVTAGFVSRYPEWVSSVILVAPAGIMKKMPFLATLLKIPFLGNLLIHTVGSTILSKISLTNHLLTAQESKDVAHFNEYQEYHIKNNPGLMRSFRSTVLNFDFNNQKSAFESLGQTHAKNILGIWGDKDTVVPTELQHDLKRLIPTINMVIKDHASHSVLIEYPEFVADTIDEFLKKIE